MAQDFAPIFSLPNGNFREPFEKVSSMASICAALAGEHAQTSVKAVGNGMAMAGALLTARDFREAAAIQNTYTLKAYEDCASSAAKLGSLWIDLFRELYPRPLNGGGA